MSLAGLALLGTRYRYWEAYRYRERDRDLRLERCREVDRDLEARHRERLRESRCLERCREYRAGDRDADWSSECDWYRRGERCRDCERRRARKRRRDLERLRDHDLERCRSAVPTEGGRIKAGLPIDCIARTSGAGGGGSIDSVIKIRSLAVENVSGMDGILSSTTGLAGDLTGTRLDGPCGTGIDGADVVGAVAGVGAGRSDLDELSGCGAGGTEAAGVLDFLDLGERERRRAGLGASDGWC